MTDIQKQKIDTHIHIVPPTLTRLIDEHGGDPSGWHLPEWSSQSALKALDDLGISKAYFSVTAPGPAIVADSKDAALGRKVSRDMNTECIELIQDYPDRFELFASTPSWIDVQGTIEEIRWALEEKKLPGIVIMSTYSEKLLGDETFTPIWDILEKHKAIVFIHPSDIALSPKFINGKLSQPWADYPTATTRTALDLILSNTIKMHPSVKIILSHAGGTLPYIADRMLSMARHGPAYPSHQDLQDGFRSFYLDVALSTSPTNLNALLDFTTPDKILFGSDWPYAPYETSKELTQQFHDFLKTERGSKLLGAIRENALSLFVA